MELFLFNFHITRGELAEILTEKTPDNSWNSRGWPRVKIFYLYNVKITVITPSLPSIFTDQFSPAQSYDGHKQEIC